MSLLSSGAKGGSDKWKQTIARALALFDDWATTTAAGQAATGCKEWSALPASVLCKRLVYEKYAQYLVHEYVSTVGRNKDNYLDCDTVLKYFGVILNLSRDKYEATGGAAAQLFFTCLKLDCGTSDAVWLKGLKGNIKRDTFQRAVESGEKLDKSEGEGATCALGAHVHLRTHARALCMCQFPSTGNCWR